MSITKISIIVGAAIVTAGGSAAVATRDKWWPDSKNTETEDNQKQILHPTGEETRNGGLEERTESAQAVDVSSNACTTPEGQGGCSSVG